MLRVLVAGMLFVATVGLTQAQDSPRLSDVRSGQAAPSGGPTPTFSKEVLPILQRSCQACHRPGTPAPSSRRAASLSATCD